MTLSAEFSVNSDPDVQEHLVAYAATVNLAVLSLEFHTCTFKIVSSSKTGATFPTVTLAGTPTGSTASFPQVADPGDGLGRSWVVKCTVTDAQGNTDVKYRVVGTVNGNSKLPICADEYNYRDATHGWSQSYNQLLNTPGGLPGSGTKGNQLTSDGTTWFSAAGGEINVRAYGVISATATVNTATIQSAIDAVFAAGGGVIRLPTGEIPVAVSTLSESYFNYHVAVPATEGCLVLRSGVTLRGNGIGKTILKPNSATLTCIHIVDGSDSGVEDLEIDSDWTAAGAGHGILQVSSADAPTTAIDNLTIRNIFVHEVGSYGLGIENGAFTNVLVENFRTLNTGADGIDIKNRPLASNVSRGIVLDNIYVENPGRRLDGQTGVDIRGRVHGSNITVIGVGRATVQMSGIRFRTAGADEGWGDRATVTGFYVLSTSAATANVLGVDMGGADCSLVGGIVEDCSQGVTIGGNGTGTAERNAVVAVSVRNASAEAFYTYASSTSHNKFVGCSALDSLYGFSTDGAHSLLVGCEAINCGTPHRVSAGSLQSEMLIGNKFEADHLVSYSTTAGRVVLEARGTAANIDIAIDPKGSGLVRVGTHAAIVAETVTGYITIKDAGGTTRKVAVVS